MDLSAASIRNVLADLDETGFLQQPHTSAGRVPTDRAIRFFIDALMRVESVPQQARAELDARVAEIYARSGEPLRESGRLLSELSGAAAVVSPVRASSRTLAQMRFISTRKDRLLAVPFTRYTAEAQKNLERNRHRSRTQAGLFGEGEEGGKIADDDGGGDD